MIAARLVRVVAARLLRASAGEVGGGEVGGGEVARWRHACALGEREDRRGTGGNVLHWGQCIALGAIYCTGGNVLHWVQHPQCNSLHGGNLLHPMAIHCSQCNKLPR